MGRSMRRVGAVATRKASLTPSIWSHGRALRTTYEQTTDKLSNDLGILRIGPLDFRQLCAFSARCGG